MTRLMILMRMVMIFRMGASRRFLYIYSQTCIKRPLKGNVKSGPLKRWSVRKGLRV